MCETDGITYSSGRREMCITSDLFTDSLNELDECGTMSESQKSMYVQHSNKTSYRPSHRLELCI